MESIEEDIQGPDTPEITGEDTPRSHSDHPEIDPPEIQLHSAPSVTDRLDHLESLLTRFITASISNVNTGGPGSSGTRRSTSPMPEASPENYIQAEIERLRKDIKERFQHKLRSLTTEKDSFAKWRADVLNDALLIDAKNILTEEETSAPKSLSKRDAALWQRRNDSLYVRMFNSMTPTVRQIIGPQTRTSAADLFIGASECFGISAAKERYLLIQELTTLKLRGNDWTQYLNRYREIQSRLEELNVTKEDIEHDLFLIGLGSWNSAFVRTRLDEFFATGQRSQPIKNLNLKDLQGELSNRAQHRSESANQRPNEESNQKVSKKTTPESTTNPSNQPTTTGSKSFNKESPPKCSYCSRLGHTTSTCWFKNPSLAPPEWTSRTKTQKRNEDPSSLQPRIGATRTPSNSSTSSDEWLVDSCASLHITGNKSAFASYMPLNDSASVEAIFGHKQRPIGIGSIVLQIEGGELTLKNVRHIPSITSNIISLGRLVREGYHLGGSTPIPDDHLVFSSPDGREFMAELADNDVYRLRSCVTTSVIEKEAPPMVFLASTPVPDPSFVVDPKDSKDTPMIKPKIDTIRTHTLVEWHHRLGHLNTADILRLASDPEATGIRIKGPTKMSTCEICRKANAKRHISKTPAARATRPFTRIHIDLAGGGKTLGDPDNEDEAPLSHKGARYFLIITDDATRFRWVYFLAKKSDAIIFLERWLSFIKNLGFPTPAYMKSDNEFISKVIQNWLTTNGIQWEPSNPHSSWQNGASERSIGVVMARTRTILIDSNLPKKFWADALDTAVHLTNNLPTSVPLYNDATPGGTTQNPDICPSPHNIPISALLNVPPQLTHYARYGSTVCYHLHGSQKPTDKISARGRKGHIVGYNGDKIFRVWDPDLDEVILSSDIEWMTELKPWDSTGGPITSIQPTFAGTPTEEPIQPATTDNANPDPRIPKKRGRPKGSRNKVKRTPTKKNSVANTATEVVKFFPETDDPEIDSSEDDWIRPAKHYKVYAIRTNNVSSLGTIPQSYKEATSCSESDKWLEAMKDEINLLRQKRCWHLVRKTDLPHHLRPIPGRWAYDLKLKPNGEVRYKARWVVKGNIMNGHDLEHHKDPYAPVVNPTTTLALLSVATHHGWTILQADAVLAFLNGELKDPVYMAQPRGFEEGEKGTLVCQLDQALYGLEPSARIWYDTLAGHLESIGFRVSPYDSGLWIHTTRRHLYISSHVDDFGIIAEISEEAYWTAQQLQTRFELKDVGPMRRYLGMEVAKLNNGDLKLTQTPYIEDLLASFGMASAHPVKSPMDAGLLIDDDPDPTIDKKEYQRGTGSLQWLCCKTRPELSRVASLLATYNAKPTNKCWTALKHALRYLAGSKTRGITMKKGVGDLPYPVGHSDSDWAGPLTDSRKSVSGHVFLLGNTPILWKSRKQTCVALSSNEAEYIAASEAAREAKWLRGLLDDMNLYAARPLPPFELCMDNKGASDLIGLQLGTNRSKHIDTRFHFTRDLVATGVLKITLVPSKDNAADGFTKP